MPTDRRNRIVVMLTNFFLHLHPVSIKQQGIALSYTWCMGGITFFLFLVETITGVLLMFYYHPTKVQAFRDILYLEHDVPFGKLLRLDVDLPPKDRPILTAALRAGASHLVTGDLTHFGRYLGRSVQGTRILTPAALIGKARA